MNDMIYLIVIAAPILVALVSVFVFHAKITWFEGLIQAVAVLLVVLGLWHAFRFSDTWDTEIWNGEVTGKSMAEQSCPMYWRDYSDSFCTEYDTRRVADGPPRNVCSTTGSGKNKRTSCHKVQDYKTQYKYRYPYERKWFVATNLDVTYMISRVDPPGWQMPPFYRATQKGDPASKRNGYTNWIQGASASLFHDDREVEEKYKAIIPEYPIAVHDYFKVDRVVPVGNIGNVNLTQLNDTLGRALRDLGPKKQMNAVLVVADASKVQSDFPLALRLAWRGFKKNDAVVVVGVDGGNLKWVDVRSWSKENLFNVNLREEIAKGIDKPVNFDNIISTLHSVGMKDFQRRSMKEFEYLKREIPAPTWLTIMALVLSFGGSIGLAILFHAVEIPTPFANKTRRAY